MVSTSKLEEFYRGNAYGGFGGNFLPQEHAEYVDFVKEEIAEQSVYEIGSGLGAAAFSLFSGGVSVTATDIYPELCRKKFQELGVAIPVIELNAVHNSLPDSSVENYSLYQVLEHIGEPEICIQQCYRTLKPGGKIIIVSPNLLSPLASMKAFVFGGIQKWKTPYFFRRDGYTFPLGSTVVEAFYLLLRNFFVTIWLQFFSKQRILRFREPCLKKPAISDSDAIFLTEPLTIKQILEKNGFEICSFQSRRKTGVWAGSVWISAVKPK